MSGSVVSTREPAEYRCRKHLGVGARRSILIVVLSALLLVVRTGDTNASSQSVIQDLASTDSAQRIRAARYIVDNWESQTAPVLREIASFRNEVDFLVSAGNKGGIEYFRALTYALRSIIDRGSSPAIELIRNNDTLDVTASLVRAAGISDRGIRVNATIILANVADNSSICVAIDRLRSPSLDDNGRYNLLQVVRTVASYMYRENWAETQKSLDWTEKQLKDRQPNFSLTQATISDIRARLDRSPRKTTPLPPHHRSCRDYIYRNKL